MLPVESSEDYAEQLLATLLKVDDLSDGVWTRAEADFQTHSEDL
jgi:saccharopine dehydrogenase (NAD+, L-lysine-forming)